MIKGVLIDIDNTLYDYELLHKLSIDKVEKFILDKYKRNDFKEHFINARHEIHTNLFDTAASHNRLLYFQKTLELMGINELLLAKEMYDIYWDTTIENLTLDNNVIDFFESIKNKKVCFVTDLTAYIQYRKIEKLKLDKYVKYIVTSEEVGCEKPNKKIFDCALKKINLLPSEVCMIGDSFKKDIEGAINLGIKAYWKTPKQFNNNNDIITFQKFNELIGEI